MNFRSLPGLTSYEEASRLQRELVEERAADRIEDTVLFLEHESVVTRGRGLQWTGVARDRAMPLGPLPPGVAYAESERGGDLTWHGPGQLVIYPIVKLDGRGGLSTQHDVAAFLRGMELVFSRWLLSLGLETVVRENATGVWVKVGGAAAAGGAGAGSAAEHSRAENGARKIASMGIAVRKWVTWHGMAVNIVNDLKPFALMSPCGFEPEVMTRLKDLLPAGHAAGGAAWRAEAEKGIRSFFEL